MKRNLCLFGVFILTLTSCFSNNTGLNNFDATILPKSVNHKYSDQLADNNFSTIVYNGNKIVSVNYSHGNKKVYTYTGDLITKIETFDVGVNITSQNDFTYENGKLKTDLLTEVSGSNIYISKNVYYYNADGTISYATYSVDSKAKTEEKKSECILVYSNGNLVKKTTRYENVSGSYVMIYEYDTKNNPYRNISGFDLLVDSDTKAGLNNPVKITGTYNSINLYTFTSVYEYNDKGYPIKQTETETSAKGRNEIYEYTY